MIEEYVWKILGKQGLFGPSCLHQWTTPKMSIQNRVQTDAIILWPVISVKLNIGKKIAELEIMALHQEKISHVSRLIELIFKEELHCLHLEFLQMESQLNMKLQINYLQKDN